MKNGLWFLVSGLVVLLDQLSKYWAVTHLIPYEPDPLLPMLNFTLAYNTGAAFSFLHSAGDWHRWFFAGFSVTMSVVIAIWMVRVSSKARLQLFAYGLILGGAVGNLLDRIRVGYVVDFIDAYYSNYHWPIFNLADSAICIAAVLLIIDLCKNSKS